VPDRDFVEQLRARLALSSPLPGAAAHALMAPRPRREWPADFDIAHLRHAAGLLLVAPRQHAAHVVLTVRADTLDRHRGQVSLPGGRIEADETAEQAALREANEEIGVSASDVEILGALSPIDIPVSGFRLQPIVGAARTELRYVPAPHEVARVLEVPVADLMHVDRIAWRSSARDGRGFGFPAFSVDNIDIWGATPMVLAEFLTLLGWTGPTPER
jgi:8-oxo-dGTP pyrophosphatase MutT (NUDIX family)